MSKTESTTDIKGNLTNQPILNGNKFVSERHVFIAGKGCYFATLEIAIKHGTSANGVGLWTEEISFEGSVFFKAGNLNVWD